MNECTVRFRVDVDLKTVQKWFRHRFMHTVHLINTIPQIVRFRKRKPNRLIFSFRTATWQWWFLPRPIVHRSSCCLRYATIICTVFTHVEDKKPFWCRTFLLKRGLKWNAVSAPTMKFTETESSSGSMVKNNLRPRPKFPGMLTLYGTLCKSNSFKKFCITTWLRKFPTYIVIAFPADSVQCQLAVDIDVSDSDDWHAIFVFA